MSAAPFYESSLRKKKREKITGKRNVFTWCEFCICSSDSASDSDSDLDSLCYCWVPITISGAESCFPFHHFFWGIFPPFFLTFEVEASVSNEVLQMDIRQSPVCACASVCVGVFVVYPPNAILCLINYGNNKLVGLGLKILVKKAALDPEKVTLSTRTPSLPPSLSLPLSVCLFRPVQWSRNMDKCANMPDTLSLLFFPVRFQLFFFFFFFLLWPRCGVFVCPRPQKKPSTASIAHREKYNGIRNNNIYRNEELFL